MKDVENTTRGKTIKEFADTKILPRKWQHDLSITHVFIRDTPQLIADRKPLTEIVISGNVQCKRDLTKNNSNYLLIGKWYFGLIIKARPHAYLRFQIRRRSNEAWI